MKEGLGQTNEFKVITESTPIVMASWETPTEQE